MMKDTSIPYHDYSLLGALANKFGAVGRTGQATMVSAWKFIEMNGVEALASSLGANNPLGVIHALNTFFKNTFINGFFYSPIVGEMAWVDYRIASLGYGTASLELFVKDGFVVVNNAVDRDLINEFLSEYSKEISDCGDHSRSYLSARNEFAKSLVVEKLVCASFVNDFCAKLGRRYVAQMVEARVGSSKILFHRDSQMEQFPPEEPGLFGVLIALEDHHPASGLFEISPNSHLIEVDRSIVTEHNLASQSDVCFRYYHDLVNSDGRTIFKFNPRVGDAIIWHGNAIHSGGYPLRDLGLGVPQDFYGTRNSIITHYRALGEDESRWPENRASEFSDRIRLLVG